MTNRRDINGMPEHANKLGVAIFFAIFLASPFFSRFISDAQSINLALFLSAVATVLISIGLILNGSTRRDGRPESIARIETDLSPNLIATAHALKNCLQTVRTVLDLIKRHEHLSKEGKKYIEQAISYLNRATDIRALSTLISREAEKLRFEAVDVNRLIKDACNSLVYLLMNKEKGNKQIQLNFQFSEIPLAVGNADQLIQVLLNLIHNAYQAMPNGGTLTISTKYVDNKISVEIADTGVGIPSELIKDLFTPFTTTKKKGSGLGLWVSKKLIELMGGEISVLQTVPGRGTTIGIILPVSQPRRGKDLMSSQEMLYGKKVLVADDEPSIRYMLEKFITSLGGKVTLCKDGKDAINALTKEHFDIALLDYFMPYISGEAVAAEIKRVSPDTPIILITGKLLDDYNWKERIKNSPFDILLAKPVSLDDIQKTLAEVSHN